MSLCVRSVVSVCLCPRVCLFGPECVSLCLSMFEINAPADDWRPYCCHPLLSWGQSCCDETGRIPGTIHHTVTTITIVHLPMGVRL